MLNALAKYSHVLCRFQRLVQEWESLLTSNLRRSLLFLDHPPRIMRDCRVGLVRI